MKKTVVSILILMSIGFISCKNETKQLPPSTGVAPTETSSTTQSPAPAEVVAPTPAPKEIPADQLSDMTFDKELHDFGTITEGDKPEYTFTFKNTSKNDLLITNAVGSCGCTVPEYPKEAVKPGQSSKIKVSFNSDGKTGKQQKSITITANVAFQTKIIRIQANINPRKK